MIDAIPLGLSFDDVLLVPQLTDVFMENEFEHIQSWSKNMKLTIINGKTKEIIFWRLSSVQLNTTFQS